MQLAFLGGLSWRDLHLYWAPVSLLYVLHPSRSPTEENKSASGLIEFETLEEAMEAMALANNTPVCVV